MVNLASRKARVLCVDDEPAIRHVLTQFLNRMGHEVQTAANGQEGLEAIARAEPRFDVVITDSQMPVMNGFAFVQALRSSSFAGKIIVFSSTLPPERKTSLLELGVHAIIDKGTPVSELLAAITSATSDRPPDV